MTTPIFDGLRPPRAPCELRRRTLEALAREPGRAGPWEHLGHLLDELATSRICRLAWTAAVLALVAGHLSLERGGPAVARDRGPAPSSLSALADDVELATLESHLSVLGRGRTSTYAEALAAFRKEL